MIFSYAIISSPILRKPGLVSDTAGAELPGPMLPLAADKLAACEALPPIQTWKLPASIRVICDTPEAARATLSVVSPTSDLTPLITT